MAKHKMKRGGARMQQLGMKRVNLWCTPGEYLQIQATAKSQGLAVATYIRRICVGIARHPKITADCNGNVQGLIFSTSEKKR